MRIHRLLLLLGTASIGVSDEPQGGTCKIFEDDQRMRCSFRQKVNYFEIDMIHLSNKTHDSYQTPVLLCIDRTCEFQNAISKQFIGTPNTTDDQVWEVTINETVKNTAYKCQGKPINSNEHVSTNICNVPVPSGEIASQGPADNTNIIVGSVVACIIAVIAIAVLAVKFCKRRQSNLQEVREQQTGEDIGEARSPLNTAHRSSGADNGDTVNERSSDQGEGRNPHVDESSISSVATLIKRYERE